VSSRKGEPPRDMGLTTYRPDSWGEVSLTGHFLMVIMAVILPLKEFEKFTGIFSTTE
jgi:hypothetical protein